MLHLHLVSIERNIHRCKIGIERCIGVPEMSLAETKISVDLASFNVDLAVGMKGAVVVVAPSEEQTAGDVDVGSENLSSIAPAEDERENLGGLESQPRRGRRLAKD